MIQLTPISTRTDTLFPDTTHFRSQVDDRGIEPFLLAGDPGLFLLELDALRLAAATVDDGRNLARTTQAAARTLPRVLAAGCGEFLIGHLCLLPLLALTA